MSKTSDNMPTRDRSKRGRGKLTLKQRRWLYGIALASVPVFLTFGIGTEEQLTAMLGLAAAVLGIGTAALAHPTED